MLPALLEDDDRYLDFPNIGDRAELEFDAPRRAPGLERTVFAQTRGWYEVNLHTSAAPDTARLAKLRSEPGFVVREALREYAEFRSTGVVAGTRSVVR